MHRESYWKTTLMALGGSSLTMLLIVGLSAVGSSGAAVGAGLVLLTMISVIVVNIAFEQKRLAHLVICGAHGLHVMRHVVLG